MIENVKWTLIQKVFGQSKRIGWVWIICYCALKFLSGFYRRMENGIMRRVWNKNQLICWILKIIIKITKY